MSLQQLPDQMTIYQCKECGTTEIHPGDVVPVAFFTENPCEPGCDEADMILMANRVVRGDIFPRPGEKTNISAGAIDPDLDLGAPFSPSIAPSRIVAGHMDMKGKKNDNGKARWDLLPWRAASEVVNVLTFGAQKYGDHNWQHVSGAKARYTSAAMRHLVAWINDGADDPESGYHHLGHAATCLMFLLETDLILAADQERQS